MFVENAVIDAMLPAEADRALEARGRVAGSKWVSSRRNVVEHVGDEHEQASRYESSEPESAGLPIGARQEACEQEAPKRSHHPDGRQRLRIEQQAEEQPGAKPVPERASPCRDQEQHAHEQVERGGVVGHEVAGRHEEERRCGEEQRRKQPGTGAIDLATDRERQEDRRPSQERRNDPHHPKRFTGRER